MSFEPDNLEHENESESLLANINNRLEAIIFLLEIIANVEIGSTLGVTDGNTD
jgi:hypothetical protein